MTPSSFSAHFLNDMGIDQKQLGRNWMLLYVPNPFLLLISRICAILVTTCNLFPGSVAPTRFLTDVVSILGCVQK
jgi:hypothetical protein